MSKQLQHRLIFKYTSNNLFSSNINARCYTGTILMTKLQIFIQDNKIYIEIRTQCIINSIWWCFSYLPQNVYIVIEKKLEIVSNDTFVSAHKTFHFISYIEKEKVEYQTQFIFF